MPGSARASVYFVALAAMLAVSAYAPSSSGADTPAAHVTAALDDPDRWERDRERDTRSKPAEVLGFIGVEPGMSVLDLFTGGGYWAELFAGAVGTTGSVVAHTNTAYRNFAGPLLTSRFANERVPGVVVIDSEIDDLALGRERFDLIFIGLGYHDLYFYADFWPLPGRDRFFAQIFAALKPGGIIAIVDHAAAPGTASRAVQTLHRIDEDYARADWERAGFEFIGASEVLRNTADDRTVSVFDDGIRGHTDRFVYRFRKPGGP